MPTMLDDFPSLLREQKELQQEKDKKAGALSQIMKDFKEKYGCKTLKQAKRLAKKSLDKEVALTTKYVKAYKKYKKERKRCKQHSNSERKSTNT